MKIWKFHDTRTLCKHEAKQKKETEASTEDRKELGLLVTRS
jgi:hypothetical protein